MATAQGVGSAVFGAIVDRAKAERHTMQMAEMEADLAARKARDERDRHDAARERWEQCIDWLDENAPDWETVLPQADINRIRGVNPDLTGNTTVEESGVLTNG